MERNRLILVFVVFMLLLACCAPKASPADEEKAAAQVVKDFYSVHIPTNPYGTGNPRDYEASPQIHPNLVAKIQSAMKTEMGIGFDPFLCAQAWPPSWSVGAATVDGDNARVVLQATYGETQHPVTVLLKKTDGQWKIIGTHCFPEPLTGS